MRVVTDVNGTVVKRIDYDSFGNILNDTAPAFEVPFGFAGGLHDRDTGLVRFGYRDYDPEVGRWTAKDPIGFDGGDWDLYGYTLDGPINWIDPDGLSVWDIIDIYFFFDSLYDFTNCPSWGTAGNLALDSLSLLPIIPSLGYISKADDVFDITKTINKADDVVDTSKVVRKPRVKKLQPDPRASGPHTVFDRAKGKYSTFDEKGRLTKRFRSRGRTHGDINPPITYVPKRGRPSELWEIMP